MSELFEDIGQRPLFQYDYVKTLRPGGVKLPAGLAYIIDGLISICFGLALLAMAGLRRCRKWLSTR